MLFLLITVIVNLIVKVISGRVFFVSAANSHIVVNIIAVVIIVICIVVIIVIFAGTFISACYYHRKQVKVLSRLLVN